jgi:hypothetical protein
LGYFHRSKEDIKTAIGSLKQSLGSDELGEQSRYFSESGRPARW